MLELRDRASNRLIELFVYSNKAEMINNLFTLAAELRPTRSIN